VSFLVTGAGGQLGSVVLRQLAESGERALGLVSKTGVLPEIGETVRADFTDASAFAELMARERPRHVVHAGAIASVAVAYSEPERARRVNAVAAGDLAAIAARSDARFVQVSTDMVFDGEGAPYDEDAVPSPLSVYGRSKREGELAALTTAGVLVVRLPLLYGFPAAPRTSTFVEQAWQLSAGSVVSLFHDEVRTPLWLEDAASSLILAARSTLTGVLHLGGPERLSRLDMGRLTGAALGLANPAIRSMSRLDVPASEPRARDLSLSSARFRAEFGVAPGRPMAEALARMNSGVALHAGARRRDDV
jgi:dTDP-4-dehydrorhamnose reductase